MARTWPLLLAALLAGSPGRAVGDERTVELAPPWREVGRWQAHENWARCLALDVAGRRAATGGPDRWLRIWDLPEGRRVAELRLPPASG